MNNNWEKEINSLLDKNKDWLKKIKYENYGAKADLQIHLLSEALIRYKELCKQIMDISEKMNTQLFNPDKDLDILKNISTEFEDAKSNFSKNELVSEEVSQTIVNYIKYSI